MLMSKSRNSHFLVSQKMSGECWPEKWLHIKAPGKWLPSGWQGDPWFYGHVYNRNNLTASRLQRIAFFIIWTAHFHCLYIHFFSSDSSTITVYWSTFFMPNQLETIYSRCKLVANDCLIRSRWFWLTGRSRLNFDGFFIFNHPINTLRYCIA